MRILEERLSYDYDGNEFVRSMLVCEGLLEYRERSRKFRPTEAGRRLMGSHDEQEEFTDPELCGVRWLLEAERAVARQIEFFYIKTEPVSQIRDRVVRHLAMDQIARLNARLGSRRIYGTLAPMGLNRLLEEIGYQKRAGEGRGWIVTAQGERFGATRQVQHKNGTTSHETRWSPEVTTELLGYLELALVGDSDSSGKEK